MKPEQARLPFIMCFRAFDPHLTIFTWNTATKHKPARQYGSDLDALKQYDAGESAYWLASGISVDCSEDDINNCINLFCTENLSE